MLPSKLLSQYQELHKKYPFMTEENFGRIMILFHGLNYNGQDSFPDHFTHFELIFTVPKMSKLSVLTMLNPDSPFKLIDSGEPNKHILLYDNQFVDFVTDYEQRLFDFRKPEPFYFYVEEWNGDLVLKLNPIQLCDFFQNPHGELPCSFCFRNDMVQRFKNITAKQLIELITIEEKKKDNYETLKKVDEISVVTGSYLTDDQYIEEISEMIQGLLPFMKPKIRVVVGSHEGKDAVNFKKLKSSGITVFAFPIESLDDTVRKRDMKNRKGAISVEESVANIKEGIDTFGPEGVIVRLVAGMGDKIDDAFVENIRTIATHSAAGIPFFNINQYMPFTHYHWRLFKTNRPFDLEYMFKFCDTINSMIPIEKQIRFKVSP